MGPPICVFLKFGMLLISSLALVDLALNGLRFLTPSSRARVLMPSRRAIPHGADGGPWRLSHSCTGLSCVSRTWELLARPLPRTSR